MQADTPSAAPERPYYCLGITTYTGNPTRPRQFAPFQKFPLACNIRFSSASKESPTETVAPLSSGPLSRKPETMSAAIGSIMESDIRKCDPSRLTEENPSYFALRPSTTRKCFSVRANSFCTVRRCKPNSPAITASSFSSRHLARNMALRWSDNL